jgi:ClpP class serine protease
MDATSLWGSLGVVASIVPFLYTLHLANIKRFEAHQKRTQKAFKQLSRMAKRLKRVERAQTNVSAN